MDERGFSPLVPWYQDQKKTIEIAHACSREGETTMLRRAAGGKTTMRERSHQKKSVAIAVAVVVCAGYRLA